MRNSLTIAMRCSTCAASGSGAIALSLRQSTGVARSCSASQLSFAQSSGFASNARIAASFFSPPAVSRSSCASLESEARLITRSSILRERTGAPRVTQRLDEHQKADRVQQHDESE